MPAPNDLNDRIAKARGWRRIAYADNRFHAEPFYWVDRANVIRGEQCPDSVGALKGVAGLMRELGSAWGWGWYHGDYVCFEKNHQTLDERHELRSFDSPLDRPGACVGKAWLSVFEKETADASTE